MRSRPPPAYRSRLGHPLETLLAQDFQHALDRSRFALVVDHLVVPLGVLGSFQGEQFWAATSTSRCHALALTEGTLH